MGAGPEHLLASGLIAHLSGGGHSARAAVLTASSEAAPAEIATAFQLMGIVAASVRDSIAAGRFPLVLSGNCNTAPGTLAGLGSRGRAVFWFDAHADCNTPDTTLSGFLDGMALATALGWCWTQVSASVGGFVPVEAGAVVLLGTRDIDPLERGLMDRAGIPVVPSSAVSDFCVAPSRDAPADGSVAYIHCDLDVLDPAEGQANSFAVPGGLDVVAVERAIRAVSAMMPIGAAAITAYAPEYDVDQRVCRAAFRIIAAIADAASAAKADSRPAPSKP
jgi:arginase